jgi:hypothetical protein
MAGNLVQIAPDTADEWPKASPPRCGGAPPPTCRRAMRHCHVPAPTCAHGSYALETAALGGFGVGKGIVVLAEFLDVCDLAIGDQESL